MVRGFAMYPGPTLPKLRFLSNWRIKELRASQFLIVGLGAHVNNVAATLGETFASFGVSGLHIGFAAERVQTPGQELVLRIVRADMPQHQAWSDIALRRQGNDLFVRIEPAQRTWLKYLRALICATLFVVAWCLLCGVFFGSTDVFASVVQEFAQKYFPGEPRMATEYLTKGLRPTADGGAAPLGESPWTYVMRSDPLLFWKSLALVPSILAAIIGAGIAFVPRTWLIDGPSRLLRWPTPDEFRDFATAHSAWVEGTLSAVLYRRFGVHEAQRVKMNIA